MSYAPNVQYQDFELQLDATAQGELRARVLRSPFGEGGATFSLPFSSEEASSSLAPRGVTFAKSKPVLVRGAAEAAEAPPAPFRPPLAVGADLYQALFRGQVRTLFDKSRGQLQLEPDRCLRVKIKLDPNDPALAALADLPWELLHDEEVDDLFALSRQTTLVRYLDVPRPSPPISFTPPLRILAVAASPTGLPALNLDEECSRLEKLEQREPGVEVRFLRNASAGQVREALADGDFNILHFMGHGDFDRISGEGMLYFEQADRTQERVSGRTFATRLRDLRSLGLVTLNACNTGKALHRLGESPFRGVATALVLGGLPAVVAMQHPISDVAAIGFSSTFYRHLGRGIAIDAALTEGRQAILSASPDGCEWAIPVLFLRVADGNVFLARPANENPEEQPNKVGRSDAIPSGLTEATAKRFWTRPKIAGATGGMTLLLAGIYFGSQGFRPSNPAGQVDEPLKSASSDLIADKPIDEKARPNETRNANGPDTERSDPARTNNRPAQRESGKPPSLPDSMPEKDSGVTSEPRESSSAPEDGGDKQRQVTGISHDASSLTSRVVSISRRSGQGLRVVVLFQNTSARSLSLVLDRSNSLLADNLGKTHVILTASLPTSKSSSRIDLPPKGSAEGYFDFPAPEVTAREFTLVLTESGGNDLALTQAVKAIQGPP